MTKIKIYSGLSLSKEQIKQILPTAFLCPPVRRGDILKDIKDGIHVIGIIDGEFAQSLAVSPSEIGDGLRCGVRFFGSSSMGAMRAVELEDFGMVGVGKIFEKIKKEKYFNDDWLGQIFYEGSHVVSMPYMDFFFSAEDLVKAKMISKKDATFLCKEYEKLHFSERNFSALKSSIKKQNLNCQSNIVDMAEMIMQNKFRAKTEDGILLLRTIRRELDFVRKMNAKINRKRKG